MSPPTQPTTRTEGQDVLDKLAQHDSKLRRENEDIAAYIKVAKVVGAHTWFIGSAILGFALWLGKMQWTQAIHADAIKENTTYRTAAAVTQNANQIFDMTIANTVSANRTERMNDIKALSEAVNHQHQLWEKWTVPISEMWFMKNHGISNKEAYFRENKQPALKSPE